MKGMEGIRRAWTRRGHGLPEKTLPDRKNMCTADGQTCQAPLEKPDCGIAEAVRLCAERLAERIRSLEEPADSGHGTGTGIITEGDEVLILRAVPDAHSGGTWSLVLAAVRNGYDVQLSNYLLFDQTPESVLEYLQKSENRRKMAGCYVHLRTRLDEKIRDMF